MERFWFLVKLRNGATGNFLVQDESESMIRERFGWLEKRISVSKVNWATMRTLTGCIIQPVRDKSAFASGGLWFDRSGYQVTVLT